MSNKKSKFDFLREGNEPDDQNAENLNYQNSEFLLTQPFENSRTQKSENSTRQTTEQTNIQQPELSNTQPSKSPGRPKGKRSDPHYTQVTSYVRKETYKQVKRELLDDEREFSELVQQLLEEWLRGR